MFHHTLSVEASREAGPDLGGSGLHILSVSRIGSLTSHLLQVAAHQWVPRALLPQFRSGFLTRVSLKSTARVTLKPKEDGQRSEVSRADEARKSCRRAAGDFSGASCPGAEQMCRKADRGVGSGSWGS